MIKRYTTRIVPQRYWSVAATLLGNYEEGDFAYGDEWLDDLIVDLFNDCRKDITQPTECMLRPQLFDQSLRY